MRSKCCRSAGLFLGLALVAVAPSAEAQLWKRLVPTARVEVDPQADYSLTERNGPWLIMAATFSGEGAEEQARRLTLELRQSFNLTAYQHKMAFEFSDEVGGRGGEAYGAAARKRYRREGELQYAVLIGDFPRIDDSDGQQILERVKQLQPDALKVEDGGKTAQALVQARAFKNALMTKLGVDHPRGPMGQAFLARNPLLPREYFVPKGVDDFVAKMNAGVKYSLLDCPGKYSVQVATFRGRTILQTNHTENVSSATKTRRAKDRDDALDEAADNAHLLAEELRVHGWEAYEFHDRMESIVTIGSFDQVAQSLPNGGAVATPSVNRILETFGAAYNTPADPLTDIGNDPSTQRIVEQREAQLNRGLSSQQAQVVPGLNPKHVKIMRRKRGKLETERLIPMDIYPKAIEAPKRSISSAYVR